MSCPGTRPIANHWSTLITKCRSYLATGGLILWYLEGTGPLMYSCTALWFLSMYVNLQRDACKAKGSRNLNVPKLAKHFNSIHCYGMEGGIHIIVILGKHNPLSLINEKWQHWVLQLREDGGEEFSLCFPLLHDPSAAQHMGSVWDIMNN